MMLFRAIFLGVVSAAAGENSIMRGVVQIQGIEQGNHQACGKLAMHHNEVEHTHAVECFLLPGVNTNPESRLGSAPVLPSAA